MRGPEQGRLGVEGDADLDPPEELGEPPLVREPVEEVLRPQRGEQLGGDPAAEEDARPPPRTASAWLPASAP